jgi:hypothetical protein
MRRLLNILLALLAAFLIIQAGYSTQWPIAHDEAPLFYEAFLMRADGLVPYRDLFDFQMPGSFAAYSILGVLSGFDSFRIRILDLALSHNASKHHIFCHAALWQNACLCRRNSLRLEIHAGRAVHVTSTRISFAHLCRARSLYFNAG